MTKEEFVKKLIKIGDYLGCNTPELVTEVCPIVEQYAKAFAISELKKIANTYSLENGMCDLHEKYTPACCGCQRAAAKLGVVDDIKAAITALEEKS